MCTAAEAAAALTERRLLEAASVRLSLGMGVGVAFVAEQRGLEK